jgi:hypothetical protein
MTLQSDWLLLSEVYDRIDAGGIAIAMHIIGHGQVPITALRSDRSGNRFPERVEAVLAIAMSTFIHFWDNEIVASFDSKTRETNPTIFGPYCSYVFPEIRFSSVRVRQPELLDLLTAAGVGYAIITDKPQRRGAYIPQLKIFIKNLKPETLASTSAHDLAVMFENRVETKQLALKLPETRHIVNQIEKLRPE